MKIVKAWKDIRAKREERNVTRDLINRALREAARAASEKFSDVLDMERLNSEPVVRRRGKVYVMGDHDTGFDFKPVLRGSLHVADTSGLSRFLYKRILSKRNQKAE